MLRSAPLAPKPISVRTVSNAEHPLTRDKALQPARAGCLIIDVQNFCCNRDGGQFSAMHAAAIDAQYGYYFEQLASVVLPNIQRLQTACREAGIELLYTTIESLTSDGRERSLDYKISGFNVPKGSWDGRVVDAVAPGNDEIWLPKSSSSVFVSTHIDYVLRNLDIHQLVICGVLTDQCVESAVRDACDLGYLVTLVTDACATHSSVCHENSLSAVKGYCRQIMTAELIVEITATQK